MESEKLRIKELRHDPQLAKLIFNNFTTMQASNYYAWLRRYVKPLANVAGYHLATLPEPGNSMTTCFKTRGEMAERLETCAKKRGISKSALIRALIELFLDEYCGEDEQ